MAGPRVSTIVDGILLLLPSLVIWFVFADLNGWPQNDDPYYARPVQWLIEDGQFQMALQNGVLAASIVSHVAAGACSSLVFGFSYRSLFLACIIQQWIGSMSVYGTGRLSGIGRWGSLLAGFGFALQPLVFGNSFTFMTDTPAASWVALACLASTLAFTKQKMSMLLLCSLAVAWGFWIRQTNLLVLGAPLATLVLLKLQRWQSFPLITVSLLLLIPAGLSFGLLESGWIVQTTSDRMPAVIPDLEGISRLKQLTVSVYAMCLNIGLFGLPISVMLLDGALRCRARLPAGQRRICDMAAVVFMCLVTVPFVISGGGACLTNSTGFYIQNGHAGPVFLADMDEPGRWGQLGGVEWPLLVWQILTVVMIAIDGLMIWWVMWLVTTWTGCGGLQKERPESDQSESHLSNGLSNGGAVEDVAKLPLSNDSRMELISVAVGLFAMSAVSLVILLALIDPILDRYLLVILAPLLMGMVITLKLSDWRPTAISVSGSVALLLVLYAFNVVYVHDLLTWNNLRWQQVQTWLDSGLQPSEFDGGRDVNAWLRLAEDPHSHNRPGDTSNWWNGSAQRCITVGPRPGWNDTDRLTWHSWATGREHYLSVLTKQQE